MKKYDCIIIGAGPAGIFCALELVRQKENIDVLILEKGRNLRDRVCPSREKKAPCFGCASCAVISGWGGAGAFSDGKLTYSTEVGGMLGSYLDKDDFEEGIKYVHHIYLEFGAPEELYGLENQEEIETLQKKAALAGMRLVPAPVRHLGTGRTQEVLQQMQDYLLERGVAIETKAPVEFIKVKDGAAAGVITSEGEELAADYVVCAPGRYGSAHLDRNAGLICCGSRVVAPMRTKSAGAPSSKRVLMYSGIIGSLGS